MRRPDPTILDIEDAAVLWRAWKIDRTLPSSGEPVLRGTGPERYIWLPKRAAVARCRYGCGLDIPGESCSCGLYAATELSHLLAMGYPSYDDDDLCLIGQAACWGKVVEGSHGLRCARAYPTFLWVPHEASNLAKPLRDTYGCKVALKNLTELADTL